MPKPATWTIAIAATLTLAAGAAMWIRLRPMTTFLDFAPVRGDPVAGIDAWDLVITARGDDAIDEIKVESISAPLRVLEPSVVRGMARGSRATFRLHLDSARATKTCGVRITQSGPPERTYDIAVGDQR